MRTVLLATCVVLGLVALPTAAFAEDGQHSIRSCEAFDGTGPNILRRKETCAQVRWDTQADGTGVVVEFLDVDTVDGCSLLPDDGNAYHKVDADFYNASTAVSKGNWNWGVEPCNWNKDHNSIRGTDSGAMDYYLSMCAEDDMLYFRWRLYAGGNGVLIHKDHTSGHPSC